MQQNILMVYFENSTKSSCNTLFKLTTHRKTTAVKVIRDEKKRRRKALYLSVNVLSTKVLIDPNWGHYFYVSYWRWDRHFTWSS